MYCKQLPYVIQELITAHSLLAYTYLWRSMHFMCIIQGFFSPPIFSASLFQHHFPCHSSFLSFPFIYFVIPCNFSLYFLLCFSFNTCFSVLYRAIFYQNSVRHQKIFVLLSNTIPLLCDIHITKVRVFSTCELWTRTEEFLTS
jgi:hypothetical protein